MITLIFFILSLSIVITAFFPEERSAAVKWFASACLILVFLVTLGICSQFDKSISGAQFTQEIRWLMLYESPVTFSVDGLSLFFILLTSFTMLISMFISWDAPKIKQLIILLLLIELLLMVVFTVNDIFLFFIFFEVILLPIFILVGGWGSRSRKVKAAYYLFFFTLAGSIFMLLAIFLIYVETGTTNYQVVRSASFSYELQLTLWVCFFANFAIKVPIMPFHIWLPEAHVEAPTVGSVILAGLLLKLGGYGFLKFLLPLFPEGFFFFRPLAYVLCLTSVIYGAISALRQIDMKRIVAYSSVAHMNFAIMGLCSLSFYGVQGGLFLMVGHGLISAALFFLVGCLYDRYGIRSIRYYGGLSRVMPSFSFFFFFFCVCNFSLPGTCNFVGELLVILGSADADVGIAVFLTTSVFFNAGFSVLLCNRVIFGALAVQYIENFTDLTRRETYILVALLALCIILGLCPNYILSYTAAAVAAITI